MAGLSQWQPLHGTRRAGAGKRGAVDPRVNSALADLPAAANTDQVHILRALVQISQAVLCAHYFDEALEAIAHHTMNALSAASVSISRWERQTDVLRTLINVGDLGPDEERWPDNELYPVAADRRVMRLLQQGLPYINAIENENVAPEDDLLLRQTGKESELAVPVMYDDIMWGELWVTGTNGRRFGPDDVQVLQAIAAHTAVAIGRSELFSTVWRKAFEDPLTGLANRRGLEDMDMAALRPALLICDLDGFKEVNDRHGHPAGDALLCTVADALTETAATIPDSLVSRMGGDEFCIVLPRTSLEDAERFAVDATRSIIAQAGEHISLSWGAAVHGPNASDGPALIAAADAALLQSKRLGPGRFSMGVATPEALPVTEVRRRGLDANPQRATAEIVPQITQALDLHRPASTAAALEILAVHVCKAVDTASAWSVSITTEDGTGVQTYRGIDSSRDGTSGLRLLAASCDTRYPLADYPATARTITTGEPFLASVDLDDSDPAETELLESLGYRAVLGAATAGDQHHYLLEIYSDTGHAELAVITPYVRVLAHYCSRFSVQQQ
jgi:diguanylate cyclase (GGDEF)-like protein